MAMPYAHVDTRLRALAGQAEGFGRHAIGGVHGSVYHVTTLHGIIPSRFRTHWTEIFRVAFYCIAMCAAGCAFHAVLVPETCFLFSE
jgi:hypothetical protein